VLFLLVYSNPIYLAVFESCDVFAFYIATDITKYLVTPKNRIVFADPEYIFVCGNFNVFGGAVLEYFWEF
jgi:hypothetical protein